MQYSLSVALFACASSPHLQRAPVVDTKRRGLPRGWCVPSRHPSSFFFLFTVCCYPRKMNSADAFVPLEGNIVQLSLVGSLVAFVVYLVGSYVSSPLRQYPGPFLASESADCHHDHVLTMHPRVHKPLASVLCLPR